jgi:hypothetical protein
MQLVRRIPIVLLAGTVLSCAVVAVPLTVYGQQAPAATAPATGTTAPPVATPPAATPPATTPPAAGAPATDQPAVDAPADGENTDDMSIGEVPAVQTEELTPDMARKALDAYVLVQTKYQDSPLENYDDLQGFVDKDPKGKEFETDIKSFGFPDVNNWNLAVTTLSFAYTNALDDQTSDIKQQIDELTTSTEMAQDMKDRMIASLKAMIPSENNAKIVADLIADAVYGDKIKLLETTEE